MRHNGATSWWSVATRNGRRANFSRGLSQVFRGLPSSSEAYPSSSGTCQVLQGPAKTLIFEVESNRARGFKPDRTLSGLSGHVPLLFLTGSLSLAIGFVVPVHRGARSRGVAVWDRERSRGQVSQSCPAGGPGCALGFETGWWPSALERFSPPTAEKPRRLSA
jgi:hypothetical protein